MNKKIKLTRPPKHWTYYTIEYQTEQSNGVWYPIGSRHLGLLQYEFGEHTACGDCWQKTGDYGIFDKNYAIQFLNDLRTALAEDKITHVCETDKIINFRLVQIKKTYEKTLIEI